MSDPNAKKKGVRTFASDFARAKGSAPTQPKTKDTPSTPPTPVPKPSKHIPPPQPKSTKPSAHPAESKKIPAFHEIEKSLGDIDLSNNKKHTASSKATKKSKGITPSKRVGGGAIITDTRTNSYSLIQEIKKSVSGWFKSTKKKPTPRLAVPKADRRKGVIQQATTKSGTIFTADNETLKERIKARKLQEQQQNNEPETNWSPYTETGYPLLESAEVDTQPATNNVQVEFKKRSVPDAVAPRLKPEQEAEREPEPPVETPSPTPEEKGNDTSLPEVTQPAAPVIEEPTPAPVPEAEPVPAPAPAPVREETGPVPEPTTVEPTTPNEQTVAVDAPDTTTLDDPQPETASTTLSTNQLTMYISGGLALLMVTGFFGWIIYNDQTNATPDGVLVETTSTNTQLLTIDQSFTVNDLRSVAASDPYTKIALANASNELIPAALVFEYITPDMPAGIQQFATGVTFMQLDSSVPQLLIDVVDPTSVTGMLLVHESDLAAALSPLYGEINQGTFTDRSIAGIDARVLQSNAQATITYGLVQGNILVITNDPDAFAEVVGLITN